MNRNFTDRNRNRNAGGLGFQSKNLGLLGEPPGMAMNRNRSGPGAGLGLLGSGPEQSIGNMGAGMGPGMRTGAGLSGFGSGAMGNAGLNQQSFGNTGGNSFTGNMGGVGSQMNQGLNDSVNQNMMGGSQQQMSVMHDSQIAAMRDSQLQLVSNLIQQQGTMGSGGGSGMIGSGGAGLMGSGGRSGMMGSGGAGLMGSGGGSGMMGSGGTGGVLQSGFSSGILGSGGNLLQGSAPGITGGAAGILGAPGGMGGGGARGPAGGRMGNIPSLFDINTNKGGLLGKRMNYQKDNYNIQNKRMRPNQGRGLQNNRQIQNRRNDRNERRSPNRSARPREREFRSSRSSSKYSDPSPSSRSSRDRRESESSLPSQTSKKEPEEYDPAEPTEEDDEDTNMEMSERSLLEENTADDLKEDHRIDEEQKTDGKAAEAQEGDSSLTVTVSDNGRSVHDAQQKKESGTSPGSAEKKTNFYCHACGTECRTEEGFTNHMNGKKHKIRMESLVALHQQKSEQLVARMKAEEHLRKIEGKPRQRRISDGGRSSDGGIEDDRPVVRSSGRLSRFSKGFTDQPWGHPASGRYRQLPSSHLKSASSGSMRPGQVRSGQTQKRSCPDTWPRCNVCNQMFKSPQKYVRHLKTPHHIENVRERNRKSRQESSKDLDDDEEGFPDLGDLVTLDTIGFEDDLDDEISNSEQQDDTNIRSDKPKNTSPLTLPDYDPDVPVGQKYVIPVSGFFCKLCHRFYNSENAAKISHCQSQAHYDKFQKVMLAKILNKQFKDDLEQKDQNQSNQSETSLVTSDQSDPSLQITTELVEPGNHTDPSEGETDGNLDKNVEECNGESQGKTDNAESQEEAMDEDSLLEESPVKQAKAAGRGRARRGRRGRVVD